MCRSVCKSTPICGICVKLKGLLKYHVRFAHNEHTKINDGKKALTKRRYTCKYCKQVFDRVSQRNRHLRSHQSEQSKAKFDESCVKREFNEVSDTSGQDALPLFTHDDVDETSQMVASIENATKALLKPNIDGTNSENLYTFCDITINVDRSKSYQCCTCAYTTNEIRVMRRHFENVHLNMRRYSCANCPRSFKSKSGLKNHHCRRKNSRDGRYSRVAKVEPIENCVESELPSETDKSDTMKLRDLSTSSNLYYGDSEGVDAETDSNDLYECKHCDYKANSLAEIKSHNRLEHADNRPFSCDLCPVAYKTNISLERHMVKVHNGAESAEENVETADEKADEQAEESESGSVKIKRKATRGRPLKKKKKKVISDSEVDNIIDKFGDSICIEIVNPEKKLKSYQCSRCSYKTRRKHDIKRHFQRHIRRYDGGINSDILNDLNINVKTEPIIETGDGTEGERENEKRKKRSSCYTVLDDDFEKGVKRFRCIKCDYTSRRKFDVRRHYQSRHEPSHKGSGGENNVDEKSVFSKKSLVCQVCGKKCKYEKHLLDHMNIHEGRRPYLCDICGMDFTHKSYLVKHRRLHTGEQFVECETCHKRFPAKFQLRQHEHTHTGNRPYWCEYCGKGFMGSGALRTHLKTHTGEKPHKCKLCDYRCIQANSLKKHMHASHGGTYDFPCQLCSSKFKFKSHLTAHMLRHKGVMRHFCEFCGKGFVFSWGLIEHRRTHTNDRPYKCMICNQAFFRNSHLVQHIKNHHPGIEPASVTIKSAPRKLPIKPHTKAPEDNNFSQYKLPQTVEETNPTTAPQQPMVDSNNIWTPMNLATQPSTNYNLTPLPNMDRIPAMDRVPTMDRMANMDRVPAMDRVPNMDRMPTMDRLPPTMDRLPPSMDRLPIEAAWAPFRL